MKIFTSILALLIILSCSKTNKVDYDQLGIKPKDYSKIKKTYFENGEIKQLTFVKSETEYIWLNFYQSGEIKSINPVKELQCHGKYIDWYKNGKTEWVRYYNLGHSIDSSTYFYANGNPKKKRFNNSTRVITYFENGKKKTERDSVNSTHYYKTGSIFHSEKKHDNDTIFLKFFNENGKIVFKGKKINQIYYQNNQKYTGKTITYFKNNKPSSQANIVNGRLDGMCIMYFGDGNIEFNGEFNKGKSIGEHISYYHNGQIEFIGSYDNNKAIGNHIRYYDSGQVQTIRDTKNNTYKRYDENGKLRN